MAPLPGFQFRRLLRAMDAEAFCRFVADCWRARGWTVERRDGRLVAYHPTIDDARTLEVRTVPWWRPGTPAVGPTDADLVAVNRPVQGDAPSILDADDLHDVVRYAIDARDRADLFDAHLARSGSLSGRVVRGVPRLGDVRPAAVAVAIAVVLVAAAGVAFTPGGQPAAVGEAANETPGPVEPVGDPGTPSQFAATRWPGGGGGYPPGVDGGGITDPSALAEAHVARVGREPYTLVLTVNEFEDGRTVGSYEERVEIGNTWTFATSVDASGDLRADHPAFSDVGMYSAGNRVFVHVDPDRSLDRQAALRASPGDVRGLENRVERYLVAALSTNDSAVVRTSQIGDATIHRIDGTGTGPAGANRSVSALVTASGTIHELRTERTVPGTDRTVVVTLEYGFGDVTVSPPPWLGNDSAIVGGSFPLSKR